MDWTPKKQPKKTSFKEFHLQDGTVIGVFQGSKGVNAELDIVVKYKDKFTKTSVPRTPKHIHWVIDLLIKKEHDKKLTLEFIDFLLNMYDKVECFKTKEDQLLCKLNYSKPENLGKFAELNKYGEYSVEFISHVIELLSIEEKTGFKGAFMFKKVLQALKDGKDIFAIVSTATHNGRL